MPKQTISRFPLAALITPDRIIIAGPGATKDALIGRLSELIAVKTPGIKPQALLEKILRREAGISTTLDTGLSIPHARLDNIKDFIGALCVVPGGLTDPVHQGVQIRAICLFVSPNDSAFFQKHLQLLAALSSTFQPAFIDKLSAMTDTADIAAALQTVK
jgi:PTS system nitrogen regulatory IIA component